MYASAPASSIARGVLDRCDQLARCSEEQGRITRRFATREQTAANELVGGWMRAAGMTVSVDAIGNLIGRWDPLNSATTLLLGSHLDTVRDAGRYDGILGVVAAIGLVEQLAADPPPFALEIVAFADEEGVRFGTAYLGSSAVAGTFDAANLDLVDRDGVTLAQALREFGGAPDDIASCARQADDLLGYLELHIEQGPVLESEDLAVGVVSGIVGQTRAAVRFTGMAGHAGTVPMDQRRDALAAAAEFVLAVESLARSTPGLLATVGMLDVEPGAGNVVAGAATCSLDVRHPEDAQRLQAVAQLQTAARTLAQTRTVECAWTTLLDTQAVDCSPHLSDALTAALVALGHPARRLASGAGHDAAVMARLTPVGMLFVRCKGGISHHPEESVTQADVAAALAVLEHTIRQLA